MTKTRDNIYLRKDGRYEGRFRKGFKENGKPKYCSVYGHSYEEVSQKMAELQEKSSSKTGLTVNTLFSEWIQAISARVKESTIANYQMKAEKHIFPAFGEKDCSEITVSMVQNFISEKLKKGLSPRYVSDIVVLLKSIFKYADRTYQIINRIVHVVLPKKKKPDIQVLNDSEQKELQNYILTHQDRTSLGIAVAMYTGIRIGELCALKWSDVDLEKRILTVRHTLQRIRKSHKTGKTQLVITEPKSSASQRTIPIPDCLLPMLKKFKEKENTFVLTGKESPIEPRTMQYRFAAILKNGNLPSVHFHSLRHMFASNCVALGFDVKTLSEILGHSSVELTLNRYVHSSLEQKRKYMERFSLVA